jgi:hypothetical protein
VELRQVPCLGAVRRNQSGDRSQNNWRFFLKNRSYDFFFCINTCTFLNQFFQRK